MMNSSPANKKDETARFFDGYASGFDSIYGSGTGWIHRLVNKFLRQSIRMRFELTIQGCEPVAGKSILDVGCGPGHYGIALAKRGAESVLGIDFAPSMIDLARQKAREAELEDICRYEVWDFFAHDNLEPFDYTIMMGFMDYVANAREAVIHALNLTKESLFLSFPASGGFLAWQRKLRYKRKCPLFMYSHDEVRDLFAYLPGIRFSIRKIGRDFWVRADKTNQDTNTNSR